MSADTPRLIVTSGPTWCVEVATCCNGTNMELPSPSTIAVVDSAAMWDWLNELEATRKATPTDIVSSTLSLRTQLKELVLKATPSVLAAITTMEPWLPFTGNRPGGTWQHLCTSCREHVTHKTPCAKRREELPGAAVEHPLTQNDERTPLQTDRFRE